MHNKLIKFISLILSSIFIMSIGCCVSYANTEKYVWSIIDDTDYKVNNGELEETSNFATLDLGSESAVLIEQSTGEILFEKNSHEQLRPASVTKVMSILLIMDSIKSGKINYSIGKDRHINGKMVISKTGKKAVTNYIVKKNLKGYSLVSLLLETGRTHQIRVHMSAIKHPLVGDTMYGSTTNFSRVLLHSHKVDFIHPITN